MIRILILMLVLTVVPGDFHSMSTQAAEAAIQSPVVSKSVKEGKIMTINSKDDTYVKENGTGVIYLAGGCFWGLEKLMQTIPGVVRATNGYANGDPKIKPTYKEVCSGRTGYRETVRVEYKKDVISLDAILFAFFGAIDPTVRDKQGNDVGSQYQTGVYYADEESAKTVDHIANIERSRYKNFAVEIKALALFYDAEEYHQDYLDKNPGGYCHITPAEINQVAKITIDPAKYRRPSDEEIIKKLSKEQYRVAVESGTEPSFKNEFWNHMEKGIYVDIITGEPLFSSKDKFESSCGWPAFSNAIDPNTVIYIKDNTFGMRRIEVRSRAGNAHLGHVFYGDPDSPNGTRFCINSASLKFVSYDTMEKQGYGYLLNHLK